MTTKEAFDRVYSRTKPEGGCLVFTGAREKSGYGAIKVNGKKRSTHSVVAEYTLGACPEGQEVRHLCGRGHAGCVTASHLRYGTRSENVKDAMRHGTHNLRADINYGILYGFKKGHRSPKRKLTNDQIDEIRDLSKKGYTQRFLAQRFNVARTTIVQILKEVTYQKRTGPDG